MPQVATSTGGAIVVPQNKLRKSIIFKNIDATDSIFLETGNGTGVTSSTAGLKLAPGGILTFNSFLDGESTIQNQWFAIASANTPKLLWYETEDVQR